ncbi:hypothetical protein M413DRAFT_86088 [Hebeloma cylindrosporum]|uniref:Uncharacterized protein n=1 Tax=Hebeloma cylindrosporum TaxID=76867 RepID=A0A0C2YGD7_HEBCY|nr:hypothetical protein M413DRAFT_86088 [Hebeloma cylindrosporum h7]
MSSKAHNVANVISSLGGPSLNLGNTPWADDLEAGNLLLSWLADQLCESTVSLATGTEETQEKDEECERHARAAIGEVTLEPEEVLMVKNIQNMPQNTYTAPPEYMPPSRLTKQAELISEEIDSVQGEAELLKARISQTKAVSNKITHSVESLQRVLHDLDTKTRHSEERLSELSITADTTIALTVDSAKGVLRSLAHSVTLNSQEAGLSPDSDPPENDRSPYLESAQNLLQDRQNEISILITKLQQTLECVSELSLQEATRAQDLQNEARRLENAFDSLRNEDPPSKEPHMRTWSHTGKDYLVEKELQEICALLEEEVSKEKQGEGKSDALENLLSELDDSHLVNRSNVSIPKGTVVRDILQQAWALDQEAIMNAHQKALEEVRQNSDMAINWADLAFFRPFCLLTLPLALLRDFKRSRGRAGYN